VLIVSKEVVTSTEAEVANLQFTIRVDKKVSWFEVTMNDAG